MAASVSSGAKRMASPMRTSRMPEPEPASLAGLELAQPADSDGKHGAEAFLDQQADAGTEARQLALRRARALREDHHVVTAVQGLACVGKTGLEVALAGQREALKSAVTSQ